MNKQLGRYASLKHNIYIAVDPTPVDVDHAAHACGLPLFNQGNRNDSPSLKSKETCINDKQNKYIVDGFLFDLRIMNISYYYLP